MSAHAIIADIILFNTYQESKKDKEQGKEIEFACQYSKLKLKDLLQDPQFSKHSITRIIDFYKQINHNECIENSKTLEKKSKNEVRRIGDLVSKAEITAATSKKLEVNASLPDLMHHYINIYDAYILYGCEPGTKIIPLNTGNPGFSPFKPIVNALQQSLSAENLATYSKYEMQIPDLEFVQMATRYCQEEQIIPFSRTLSPNNLVVGNGSTNLYYLALKSIIKNKGDIVLITRPTYGLFIDPIFTAGGNIGFVDIGEDNAWIVQPEVLENTINYYNQKLFYCYILNTFTKEYSRLIQACKENKIDVKTIPEGPTAKLISNLTSFVAFDSYIEKLNKFISELKISNREINRLKFSYSPRVRGFYHINPHNPTGALYSKQEIENLGEIFKKHPDIYIIEDLSHFGISYGNTRAFTFASLERLSAKTIILLSLSKSYCVPGLRAGIAIGSKDIIDEMQYRLLNSSSNAPVPVRLAFEALFSTPKIDRDQYLQTNNTEYAFRRDLMQALVNGLDCTKTSVEHAVKIHSVILENEYQPGKAFDKKKLQDILGGIPLVRIITSPAGCFFHLLDVSKLMGEKINGKTLYTATGVRNALYSLYHVNTVPGEISGNFFRYTLRLSFSLSSQQIYSGCRKINQFINEHILKGRLESKNDQNFQKDQKVQKVQNDLLLMNHSIIYFYLSDVFRTLNIKYNKLSMQTINILLNRNKLNNLKIRIIELNNLLNDMLTKSSNKDIDGIYKKILKYIDKNETWLQYTPDYDHLKSTIFESLTMAASEVPTQKSNLNSRPLKLRSAL